MQNTILPYRDKQSFIEESAYVPSSATVISDVTLEKGSSVQFHSVVRGDEDHICIDEDNNVQDNCTLHTNPKRLLQIGKRVTVGHNAVLHGCMIEDGVLIDMGAIMLNGAHIGRRSITDTGALVKEGQQIPENSLAVGNPARIIRKCSKKQIKEILENVVHYAWLGSRYKEIDV